jgi:RNA polymerase sigma factor (TIGR02999 family)
VEQDHAEWNGRAHFTAVAAKYMRQIVVEHARKRDAAKRGYGERPVSLDEAIAFAPQRPAELLALDEAMEELAQVSAEKCRMVEIHFFGGMTHAEIAAVLKLHVNTVAKHLRVAQAWLQTRLT